jgi:hypothetical protein
MGPSGLCARILGVFVVALCVTGALPARAAATAQGVALNAAAGCGRGDLDLRLTTAAATNESWLATTGSGSIGGGQQGTSLSNVSSPPPYAFSVPFFSVPPVNTLVGSYVYVGTGPADPGNTAEVFVYYNCSTRQVLLSCFGAFGSCPQTAAQAAALLAPRIPALSGSTLLAMVLLVAGAGALALRRRP